MPTRELRTRAGSRIVRSSVAGIGKAIGTKLYVHREYEHVIPYIRVVKDYIKFNTKELLTHPYNVVCFNRLGKVLSFIEAPDFDTAHEPTVGRITAFKVNGHGCITRPRSNSIYHHKWLFVGDEYTGFAVQESFDRSVEWTRLLGIDYHRIGSKRYWQRLCNGWGIGI